MPSLADRIREHVLARYAQPARANGAPPFRVRAGDVHHELGLHNYVPAVCAALDAQKFQREAGLRLVRRSGPRQSTTVEWEFAFEGAQTLRPAVPGLAAAPDAGVPFGPGITACWSEGVFRPATPPEGLIEGQWVRLLLSPSPTPPAQGGRFAEFAGTLSAEEVDAMRRDLDREFGRVEGDW